MQRPTWPSLLVEPPNSRENWTDPCRRWHTTTQGMEMKRVGAGVILWMFVYCLRGGRRRRGGGDKHETENVGWSTQTFNTKVSCIWYVQDHNLCLCHMKQLLELLWILKRKKERDREVNPDRWMVASWLMRVWPHMHLQPKLSVPTQPICKSLD